MTAGPATASPGLRIGELSRRTGVSDHVLRAWERRYSLFSPERTAGGFRLYSPEDERRTRSMQALLARGTAAAQAAQMVRGTPDARPRLDEHVEDNADEHELEAVRAALLRAVSAYDEPGARRILDDLVSERGVERTLLGAVLPTLREVGAGWERGEVDVAQEHFASHLLREQMTSWTSTVPPLGDLAPTALLACPAGEQHDLGLLALAVLLRRRAWAVRFLGASTPAEVLESVVPETRPDVVILSATTPERFLDERDALRRLTTTRVPVLLAGAGATEEVSEALGVEATHLDPLSLAGRLSPLPG